MANSTPTNTKGKETTQHEIRLAYALWLYQQVRITLTKAAKIAKVSIYDFMEECKKDSQAIIKVWLADKLRDKQ